MKRELSPEELIEAKKHQQALEDIRAILSIKPGRSFIKYLFDSLDVGELPALGINGEFLHDRLGFLRAGNAIFKIVAEADQREAGLILAQLEKERYDTLYEESVNG